jgi:hypothetical protein
MNRICITHGKYWKHKILFEKPQKRRSNGKLNIDGRVLLKSVLEKQGAFNWEL